MKDRFTFLVGCLVTGWILSYSDQILLVYISCLLPLLGALAVLTPLGEWIAPWIAPWMILSTHSRFRTVQGYKISPKQTIRRREGKSVREVVAGTLMVVGRRTLEKAMQTGDYEYEGPATGEDAGGHYVNDGTGGTGSYVPEGHIVPYKGEYIDERLN